jgi:hypothetical protein
MIVGRLFTYLGQRYEPGSDFNIHDVAESKRPSFIRLYGLSERSAPRKKNKKKAVESRAATQVEPVMDRPQGGVQENKYE